MVLRSVILLLSFSVPEVLTSRLPVFLLLISDTQYKCATHNITVGAPRNSNLAYKNYYFTAVNFFSSLNRMANNKNTAKAIQEGMIQIIFQSKPPSAVL